MRSFIYREHIWPGLLVAVPVLAFLSALSGIYLNLSRWRGRK